MIENEKFKILAVDDEEPQRIVMENALITFGYTGKVLSNPEDVLKEIHLGCYDILISDMQMPKMSGIELITNVKRLDPTVDILIVTGHGSIETAVNAMKKGAEDYIQKPLDLNELEIALKRIIDKRELHSQNQMLKSENARLKKEIGLKYHLTNVIGSSEKTMKVRKQIQNYSNSGKVVLLVGEPGLGKDDIARMIHYNSPHAENSLIHFDCSSVPEEFQEIYLFGKYEPKQKNEERFSASFGKAGLVEKAHLSSLVLSKIHKLNKKCQSMLMRVIKEDKTQRVDGSSFYPASVKLLATSEPEQLETLKLKNEFRSDLYDVLNENKIFIPPLRERCEDIPLYILAYAKKMAESLGKEISSVEKSVFEKFQKYEFSGNIKELETLVDAAVIRAKDSQLKLTDFRLQ